MTRRSVPPCVLATQATKRRTKFGSRRTLCLTVLVLLGGGLAACGADQLPPSGRSGSTLSNVSSLGKELGCESIEASRVDNPSEFGVTGQGLCSLPDKRTLLITTLVGPEAVEQGVREWRESVRELVQVGRLKRGQSLYLVAGEDWIVIPRGLSSLAASESVASLLGGRVVPSTVEPSPT